MLITQYVDVELLMKCFLGQVFNHLKYREACIINKYVQRAVVSFNLVEQPDNIDCLTHVRLNADGLAALRLNLCNNSLSVALVRHIVHDDRCAGRTECFCDASTNSYLMHQ
ncbi:MAG: hypothetical protein JWM43_3838 [Acidobacteriaceae bacterium]|nr:hypothetical protein [Acidobacteriaceae bacterium]